MLSNDLERFFRALCSSFPRSDILINSSLGSTVFSRFALYVLSPEQISISKPSSYFQFGENHYILISHFLPEQYHLLLCLQLKDYESDNIPLSMVFSLEQAVFLVDKQTSPLLIKDKLSLLIKQIIEGPVTEDSSFISLLASEVNIDLTIPRVVCVVDFRELHGKRGQKNKLLSEALVLIRSFRPASSNDIMGINENSQILFCRSLNKKFASIKSQCFDYFRLLREHLSGKLGCVAYIGVGFAVSAIPEYTHSYSCAQLALQYSYAQSSGVVYSLDHVNEIIFENTSMELLNHYFNDNVRLITENPIYLQTIESLLLHNMNLHETARALYIHPNTLNFRIKQIKSLLVLDPLNSNDDRYTLRLIYRYFKWHSKLYSETPLKMPIPSGK